MSAVFTTIDGRFHQINLRSRKVKKNAQILSFSRALGFIDRLSVNLGALMVKILFCLHWWTFKKPLIQSYRCSHDILFKKLEKIGVVGSAPNLYKSYCKQQKAIH